MEPLAQKSLERVVSQKALQMGSSFPCKICVLGFLCGVCLTSLFLAALTSLGALQLGGISFSSFSPGFSTSVYEAATGGECNSKQKAIESIRYVQETTIPGIDERVSHLYSVWGNLLSKWMNEEDHFLRSSKFGGSNVPKAPHLENCKLRVEVNLHLDTRVENQSFPPWTIWKGMLDHFQPLASVEQKMYTRHPSVSDGSYPPWVTGSDEENYPLTRKVQHDVWLHQHPPNCSDPSIRFLVADWERIPGFGIGAQFAGMCGLLAIAINENRVLVTNYYNRADHDGCKGSSRSGWSCYFFPETSKECRERAFELLKSKEAWEKGIITGKENYTSKEIWSGRTPRNWGDPWTYLQPTTDVNGSLIAYHRKMDRRWWRAQDVTGKAGYGIEKYVWSNHKPWIPRPLLSMHVRMGDKACEMKVVGFQEYMRLAGRIRKHFPHLNSIWLSTEMQEVIDRSKLYPGWKFYYTNVTRQVGNMTMATYEASLGRETSTNYPLVNFLMASEADFFVGALGSTWCFLIDGMRNTGGKVMSGYLSVNKDRFW